MKWSIPTPLTQSRKKSKRETVKDKTDKLRLCTTSSPQSSRDVWTFPKRKAPLHGSLVSHLKNVVSTYTKECLGMHSLCMHYGWKPNNNPQICNCGAQFSRSCHDMPGFPIIHHNEIRDITATLKSAIMLLLSHHPNRSVRKK